jgi:hypothetical protein
MHPRKKLIKVGLSLIAGFFLTSGCELMPRNSLKDCRVQCAESDNPGACYDFCDCIHQNCQPLSNCLDQYENAAKAPAKP